MVLMLCLGLQLWLQKSISYILKRVSSVYSCLKLVESLFYGDQKRLIDVSLFKRIAHELLAACLTPSTGRWGRGWLKCVHIVFVLLVLTIFVYSCTTLLKWKLMYIWSYCEEILLIPSSHRESHILNLFLRG